jgi:hypothetical protein
MKTRILQIIKKPAIYFCIFGNILFHNFYCFSQYDTSRQPIYFHISHHQEAVGSPLKGFPLYGRFKENLKTELELLDSYGVVSDQSFSDFIVSVILYMDSTGLDPNATDIFTWFNKSNQNLGYHFHPSTWDVNIRLDKIKNLDLESAIIEYYKWEKAYYDWSDCITQQINNSDFCGTLDTTRLGGIALMLEYFKKPLVNECLTLLNPAAGQVIRQKYGQEFPVVGQAGAPHSYYASSNFGELWMSDWMFTTEPGLYVFKIMGNLFIQNRSQAWMEGLFETEQVKQILNLLSPDIPHIFAIHLTVPPIFDNSLKNNLDFLTEEFIPKNPGSRFISTYDIPDLVLPNSCEYTMTDLEGFAMDLLNNWSGRPPAYAKIKDRYTSLAALFKALYLALKSWYKSPVPHNWPDKIEVPEFIWPPNGERIKLLNDIRLAEGVSFASMLIAINNLDNNDTIPYTIYLPGEGLPIQANSAEFLNGMCNLFLRLRQGESMGKLYILPSYIIPVSYIPVEKFQSDTSNHYIPTYSDWLSGLQLWTAEPLTLKKSNIISTEEFLKNDIKPGFFLEQNYPNPFKEFTEIKFYVSENMHVLLDIYDILGTKLFNLTDNDFNQGWHSFTYRASNISNAYNKANIYICKMSTKNGYMQKKLVMIK